MKTLCIAYVIATAWGLAPAGSCVLDCNVSGIYSKASLAPIGVTPKDGTCDQTIVGETEDKLGAFWVVYAEEDGTWHWLSEQDPLMCDEGVKP